jgi:hypothetical protein
VAKMLKWRKEKRREGKHAQEQKKFVREKKTIY